MNESFSHHITVFVESADYGVLGAHVFFTGQITPDQQLSSTSKKTSPTLHVFAQRNNRELLIPCLLVCVLLLLAALLISHVYNIYLTVILALILAWLSKQLEINSISNAGNSMWLSRAEIPYHLIGALLKPLHCSGCSRTSSSPMPYLLLLTRANNMIFTSP